MRSPENFDPSRAAEAAFRTVDARHPGLVTPEQAAETVQTLAEGARVHTFISPLAINKLLGKTKS